MGFRAGKWRGPVLSRRRMLQLIAAASAAAMRPDLLLRGAGAGVTELPPYGFLSTEELAILDAATSFILPSDEQRPGAKEIGVVGYVQSLLSFLPGSDANCDRYVNAADLTSVQQKIAADSAGCPQGGDVNGDEVVDAADVRAGEAAVFRAHPMFAGGPFSGRNPQPHFDVHGAPCSVCHGVNNTDASSLGAPAGAEQVELYPPAAFRQFLPLNRLQRLSWKVRILGAQSVPEVADNALLAELPEVDLRRRYRDGVAELDLISRQTYDKPFVDLSPQEMQDVFLRAYPPFVDLLYRHVIQGIFSAPEYGGNRNQLGWQLGGFDGDSQPLGYEIYDESVEGFYRERPDKPNSGPDPGEDCSGFSDPMKQFLDAISGATGGRRFSDPYCLGVDR